MGAAVRKGGFHFRMRTLNIIVYALALVLAVTAYFKGEQRHILGITEASKTLLLVLPTLIGAFLIASYVRVLVPEDVMGEWLGEKLGLKGILVGYLQGLLPLGALSSVFPSPRRFTMRAGVFKPSQRT